MIRGISPDRRNIAVTSSKRSSLAAIVLAAVIAATSCTAATEEATTSPEVAPTATMVGECADVIDATIDASGDAYRVSATILSGDTGWEKYADAWEVRAPDGTVLGTRVLAHPHVNEQPFTRSLDRVEIPAGIVSVEIVARDSVVGFCGEAVDITVPGG
jgi:hypothetical protein